MRCCFFAGDVEASVGWLMPPLSNMISFALVEVGNPENFFYAELKPLFPGMWARRTEEIHHITREYLAEYGKDSREMMEFSARWVLDTAGDRLPIYCAKPISFDYGHMSRYYRYSGVPDPFFDTLDCREHSRLIFGLSPHAKVKGKRIKREFPSSIPHTHHALSDSFEYEEQVAAMLRRLNPFEVRGR
jgi:hypothetical protein